MNLKEELLKLDKLINKETLRVNGNLFRSDKNIEVRSQLEKKFNKYPNIKMNEMIYLELNDYMERPRCKCSSGGELTFISYKDGYYTFCGKPGKCSLNTQAQSNKMSNAKKNMTDEEYSEMFNKKKITTLDRYGVDNYFKLDTFIESNQSEELKNKRKSNRIKSVKSKYGVDNVFQIEKVKDDIKKSNIKKYGVENQMQLKLSDYAYEKLNDLAWLQSILEEYSAEYVSRILDCDNTTIFRYITKHNIVYNSKNTSTEEYIMMDLLEELGVNFIKGDRILLENKHEIDFYIPDYNLAIEVNGLYWHSEKIRPDKNYHQKKYDICKSKGIELIQFWDFEINNNIDVIKSIISNKCNKTKHKIYARKCKIEVISNTEASIFISENHLQPIKDNQLSISLGSFYNGELVSVISFRCMKSKFILTRFCSKKNTNVLGSFSKMMKFFVRDINTNNLSIVTYSDNRYSSGSLYQNNGFELRRTNEVTYSYTKDFKTLLYRSHFMKSKLKNLNGFDYNDCETEHQNMLRNGYYRVYGCKIDTWEYKNN